MDGEIKYCVSSVRSPESGNSYGAANLFGASAAAWVPESSGYALGEWISVEFDRTRKVAGFCIYNGYQKSSDIFYKNSRVRALDVRTSQGDAMRIRLDDGLGAQNFSFKHPIDAKWIAFTIREVFDGKKYTDTAISKLDITYAE